MPKVARYVTILVFLFSALEMAKAQVNLGACKSRAVSQCSLRCGDTAMCIFGCEIGQIDNADQCHVECGADGTCLAACLFTVDQINLCFNPPAVVNRTAVQVRYASNLNIADSWVNLTNTGADVTSTDGSTGNMCVNVYAFSPDEQLISCCSCTVTPNGLAVLSVKNDLISNPLTPSIPNAISIKLIASQPGGTTCNAAAIGTLSQGLAAWGTSTHAVGSFGGMAVTETPFSMATANSTDLMRVATLCGFIRANGSGYGICKSCRVGGLGAATR